MVVPARPRRLFISLIVGLSFVVIASIGKSSRESIHIPDARFLAKHKAAAVGSNDVLTATSTAITQRRTNKPQHKADAAVRFVFTIGIEGTGYHLVQSMVMAKQSPLLKRLKQVKIYPELTRRMSHLLYTQRRGNTTRPTTLWGSMTACGNQRGIGLVEDQLVDVLQTIECMAKNATMNTMGTSSGGASQLKQRQQPPIISIPFNTMTTFPSMVSYPHMMNSCRQLEYPDLDIFYQVCDRANVQCEHMYIYRDPYEVLYSTTIKRNFNRNVQLLPIIHLYKSMLKIIYTQLVDHASRTIGCFGMFERGQESQWKYQLGEILGWTNQTKYDQFFDTVYSPPSASSSGSGSNTTTTTTNNSSNNHRKPFEKADLASAMKSFIESHERVRELCETTVRRTQPSLSSLTLIN
jgi:hypothetical protein